MNGRSVVEIARLWGLVKAGKSKPYEEGSGKVLRLRGSWNRTNKLASVAPGTRTVCCMASLVLLGRCGQLCTPRCLL